MAAATTCAASATSRLDDRSTSVLAITSAGGASLLTSGSSGGTMSARGKSTSGRGELGEGRGTLGGAGAACGDACGDATGGDAPGITILCVTACT